MRLSNLADYAVVVMTVAARERGMVSAAQIADKAGIPAPTVAKLMSALSRAGLLISSRGAAGGATLARCTAGITLAEIIEAIEGPIALTACVHDAGDCALTGSCAVRPHWAPVNRAVRQALTRVTLAELAGAPAAARTLEMA
ncbi:SUF system Fe-S cluster assembly regulator [Sandaracinobacteroides saxicola]|uniref:SUF system Fe-S cluster assembly regulator n=1 Tax=Sandaracinobacteroides saxicola TaxID=2759707 RepID=A0A7G5IMU1_9SPHN|nr:SUF system Fe-S cluster assembly regulator [Sandaracinobacteroides saxicola]QMW24683.1 SUF system Fe-S cluster assembly regulator [Sandaracinobacteroides saxicola]